MTLELLNNARVLNGKKPLKAWKESKAKLADALERECEGAHGSSITPEQVDAAGLNTKRTDFDEPTVSHHTLTLDELKLPKSKAVKGVKDNIPEVDPPVRGHVHAPTKAKPIKQGSLKSTSEHASPTVTLTAIAKELGMDPKVARAKMRRVTVPADMTAGSAHTYHVAHKQHIIDLLKRDFRKKS